MKLGDLINNLIINNSIPNGSHSEKQKLINEINELGDSYINEDLSDIKSELNDLQHQLGFKDWRD